MTPAERSYREALERRAAEVVKVVPIPSASDVPIDDATSKDIPCVGCPCQMHRFEDGFVTAWMIVTGDTESEAEAAYERWLGEDESHVCGGPPDGSDVDENAQ
jgi:hypothetical protein